MNEQVSEAARCLHCDCLKLDTCKLRQYAEEYHAILLVPKFNLGTSRHGMHRPKIALGERSGSVLYEPGKCIKCGLCVAITSKHGILPGMAMTGRGIQSQVRPALGATLAEGLGPVADACVCACPTAALASERNRHREVRSTSLRGTSNLVERTSQ